MSLEPMLLRATGDQWQRIVEQCDRWAQRHGQHTYKDQPSRYRFLDWAEVDGVPSCRVWYFADDQPHDLGRIVAK